MPESKTKQSELRKLLSRWAPALACLLGVLTLIAFEDRFHVAGALAMLLLTALMMMVALGLVWTAVGDGIRDDGKR